MTTERAYPFNSLYWHFMHKHRGVLNQNPRTNLVSKGWDRKADDERGKIVQKAQKVINTLETL